MNFQNISLLPWILVVGSVFIFMIIRLEMKFFKLVKLYWFYKRSLFSYISSLLFCLGILALLVSLLDLRGPEEKIKAGIPTERTIILIDTSASMLAEDVRPSRLQKAVLIAKHFARKAAGHQIAIVVFAEIQKKIVPFTNDVDLIDARLESIKNLRNQNGSSALTVAIQESIQYFREAGELRGNLLIITDGEETAEDIKLKVPKDIHIAIVGVGTAQGGRIPLDDGRGFRFGYKKNKGQDVVTKLNETFFKKIASDVPSGKYWLTNSYSLPTDEILDFFKGEKANGDKEQDMVIKPVLVGWIVVPAIIILILSYFIKTIRIFALGLFLFIGPVKAEGTEEKKIEIPQEVLKKMRDLQKGNLNRIEKVKLADDLQKSGAKDEAIDLYNENLPKGEFREGIPSEAYLNYGTALLEKGDVQKGLQIYESLLSVLDNKDPRDAQIKDKIEKNILNFFKQQEKKKQDQKKQDKQDKENKEDKEQKEGSEGSDQKEKKEQGKGKPNSEKDKSKEHEKGEDKKKNEDSGKDKENDNKNNEDKSKDNPDMGNDREKKDMPPKKLTPKLKQLMSDDRQLQMKIIEQGTKDMNRRQNRDNKDW